MSEYVVRLLRHMDEHGHDQCVPANDDPGLTERPLFDFAAEMRFTRRPARIEADA